MRSCHEWKKRRISARRESLLAALGGAIGRPTGVIDDVRPGVLVAIGVRFHNVPVEDGEYLVEACKTLEVGTVQVGDTTVAVPHVGWDKRQSEFAILADAIRSAAGGSVANVYARPCGEVVLPTVNANFSHVTGRAG